MLRDQIPWSGPRKVLRGDGSIYIEVLYKLKDVAKRFGKKRESEAGGASTTGAVDA